MKMIWSSLLLLVLCELALVSSQTCTDLVDPTSPVGEKVCFGAPPCGVGGSESGESGDSEDCSEDSEDSEESDEEGGGGGGGAGPCVFAGSCKEKKGAGVRYRSFTWVGNDGLRMGVGNLGDPRFDSSQTSCYAIERRPTFWQCPQSYDVSFTYDPVAQQLINVRGNDQTIYDLSLSCNRDFAPPAEWDALEILVSNRNGAKRAGTVDLLNVELLLNGETTATPIGNFCGGGPNAFESKIWTISDVDLSVGFTVSGTIVLGSAFGTDTNCRDLFGTSQEANKVELLAYKSGPCPMQV